MVSATGTRFGPGWFTPRHHIFSLRTLLRQVPHIYASKSGQGKNGQTLPTRSYLPSVCVPAFPLEVGSGKEQTGPPHTELPAICVCVCISTRSRVWESMDRPSPHGATCYLCVSAFPPVLGAGMLVQRTYGRESRVTWTHIAMNSRIIHSNGPFQSAVSTRILYKSMLRTRESSIC